MKSEPKEIYSGITSRKYIFILMMGTAVVLSFILDIMSGPAWLSVREVVLALLGLGDSTGHAIVWVIRLPMAAMAVVVGAALGIAGAEMQTILDNPLASPYTLGISAAAGFGAALAFVLGVGVVPFAEEILVPFNAFFFSFLCCLAIYFIANKKKGTTETIVLAGIALLFLFNSMIALLEYIASADELQAVIFWLFGSLSKATLPKVAIVFVVLILIIPIFALDAWKLTALRLGDNKAKSLGINVEKLRVKAFVLISILTATAVCFVGTIGFVGLVAPHISRMLVGEDQRYFMPLSALGGAFLLSVASIASKLVVPGAIFPIGIATSFIGVPFFLFMILRRRRDFW
ncbi:iron ABC transporter permease [Methanosarcina sp. 2.H.T.1A.6]|uniref:FecCD family ABC transporter permease n=1 Tax=unclassified Methanosarcina TaxID=2644672 RepID=UPI0006213A15|nr:MULTISPECIES: iron ABC transporter permease [unclassified Methanosarcina]KKG14867.1 iron ABC transporter permease [Methanosarcina sp. 2.H.T.1A.15]KKG19032.1 iron ABC transporter permease [Methanosarcina sp. 2.H.T.1A.3]KKG20840.1 iron ABC transporter permease [Methanosarcina sp. 2.H.T.1A.6]KKG22237.1 iron ABC transporter permease [Methanosarcina sp. 2.H.T.1A.8]